MIGVLYVSHGSRIKAATDEAVSFIETVKQSIDISLQEICFLELAQPDIQEGVQKLIIKGATKISIIPVLLLSAGHYFKDIPRAIDVIKTQYPDVTFTYGEPLGVQPRVTAILKERIEETKVTIKEDAKLLVVGRGSYNPQTKVDIAAIGHALYETTEFKNVDICYLAACFPSFEEALQDALKDRVLETLTTEIV